MTMPADTPVSNALQGQLSEAQLAADRQLEMLLDELVASSRGAELPAEFTASLVSSRPFAPWEVRRPGVWKVPAGIGAGLLTGSLGLFFLPLASLGPETAATLWFHLLAASVSRPLSALHAAGPLLAEAVSRVSGELPAGTLALLGAGAALGGGLLVYALVSSQKSRELEPAHVAHREAR